MKFVTQQLSGLFLLLSGLSLGVARLLDNRQADAFLKGIVGTVLKETIVEETERLTLLALGTLGTFETVEVRASERDSKDDTSGDS